MDMTESIQPRSDQINADSLIGGPQTYTIEKVTEGAAEQPFDFHLIESPGRVYRPSKSMRRVIVEAWGPKTENYAGKRLTIYRNPEIRFGRDKVGGLEISHLSHISKPLEVNLTATRGKRKPFKVNPLPDAAPAEQPDWDDLITQADGEVHTLRAIWQDASQRGAPEDVLNRIKEAATAAQKESN